MFDSQLLGKKRACCCMRREEGWYFGLVFVGWSVGGQSLGGETLLRHAGCSHAAILSVIHQGRKNLCCITSVMR